jgi:hypothetical protein
MPRRSPATSGSKKANGSPPFLQLDYLYVPSADVAKDVEYFTGVLHSPSREWGRALRCFD